MKREQVKQLKNKTYIYELGMDDVLSDLQEFIRDNVEQDKIDNYIKDNGVDILDNEPDLDLLDDLIEAVEKLFNMQHVWVNNYLLMVEVSE